jgi:hypothetical protein
MEPLLGLRSWGKVAKASQEEMEAMVVTFEEG